jgi:hypothetical protein
MMTTSRAALLGAYLERHADKRFCWLKWNCCHFVAGWMHEVSGFNPMHGLPYTPSGFHAQRLQRRLGGTLADAWAARLGRAPIAPTLAQVGDVVLVPLPGDHAAVGICTGRHAAVLTLADGLAMLPIGAATHAWRLTDEAAPC